MADIQALVLLIQEALKLIGTTLALTAYRWPETTVVEGGACYDYIVVGAGTAGCIVANRLAENKEIQVLLIEAGGDPPLESVLMGLFPLLARSIHDYNYSSVYDPQIAQYTRNKVIELTSGKMLGGSSSLHHGLRIRGYPRDYDEWAYIINDKAWNFKNMLPYMKKSEKMLAKEILYSKHSNLYGKDGYVSLTKEHEDVNDKYLEAIEEIGHKRVDDINVILGYTEPVLPISKDGIRQSMAEAYLRKFKNKNNLHVMKNTEVIKIIIDDNKNAKGVIATNGTGEFKIYSTREVVITAGAFNTPKLLMLSGIGPKEHLEKFDIEVISNLPVGKNLQDHVIVPLLHKIGPSNITNKSRDPHKFPTPTFVGFASLNKSRNVPDYLTINLVFRNNSFNILQLCSALFNYNSDVVEPFSAASNGNEVVLTVLSKVYPKSRGRVELKSKNHTDSPLIYLNAFSDEQDLTDTARYLQDFVEIQKSTYFQSVNAEIIKLNIGCEDTDDRLEFWKCYVKNSCSSSWHFTGTCSLGMVVDTNLKVKGVGKLRVADASVIPKIPSAKMNTPVMAIAEKAADMIKCTYGRHKKRKALTSNYKGNVFTRT